MHLNLGDCWRWHPIGKDEKRHGNQSAVRAS